MNDKIAAVREMIARGGVVALTGAGISQESGIPTFRGKGGLWEKYPPEDFATPDGLMRTFERDPGRLSRFILDIYDILVSAAPNGAHLALARLEKEGLLDTVITQNIDGLHQRAGSAKVLELHGDAFRLRCPRCGRKISLDPEDVRAWLRTARKKNIRPDARRLAGKFLQKCPCGGRARIDIVLFTEPLPQDVWEKAWAAIEEARTVLLVGTSGVVYPAAGLPGRARELGKKIVEVNLEPSELSDLADVVLLGKASRVFAELMKEA